MRTHLRVEHVHVLFPISRVDSSRVGLEQAKSERFRPGIALVSEEGVRIDGKGGAIIPLELQQALQRVLKTGTERSGRGRV